MSKTVPDLSTLRHLAVSCLGKLAATLRYNGVQRVQRGETWYCRKHRRWLTGPLIRAGNAWLRWQGAGVQILDFDKWARREEQIYATMYGMATLIDRDALWLPILPGERLDVWLAAPARSPSEKTFAVSAALASLVKLHQCTDAGADGLSEVASHGDATVSNVLFDSSSGRASWCDFETQHDILRPAVWRHADDLRALLCSAAVWFHAEELPPMVENFVAGYARDDVISTLQDALDYETHHPCSYHAAQAHLGAKRLAVLSDLVARNR